MVVREEALLDDERVKCSCSSVVQIDEVAKGLLLSFVSQHLLEQGSKLWPFLRWDKILSTSITGLPRSSTKR